MRPFTPDVAVDVRVPSDVQLAPDGRAVAFCVAPVGHRQTDPTSTIYVVPADGGAAPRDCPLRVDDRPRCPPQFRCRAAMLRRHT